MRNNNFTVSKLLLDAKALIPFPAAQVTITQPSIYEIAMAGGDNLILMGAEALSRDYSKIKDNSNLDQLSNFEIFMRVIQEKTEVNKKIAYSVEQVLDLIFPTYKIGFTPMSIVLQDENKQIFMIDKNRFDDFGLIIRDIFCLADIEGTTDDYNPVGPRAAALAEKFRKKRELLAELRRQRGEDDGKSSIYQRYVSILAVGEKKDKNILYQYCPYQLLEEFKRFQLKEGFDYTFQAKMAGATKIKDAKDWMDDIQFGVKEEN